MRNDLTILEQGEHLARRQELIGFKQGDNRFTNRQATVACLRTTKEIAQEIGISEKSMKNRMQVARNIVPEVKEAIRNTATVAELKTTPEIAKSNGEIISPLKSTKEIAQDIGISHPCGQKVTIQSNY